MTKRGFQKLNPCITMLKHVAPNEYRVITSQYEEFVNKSGPFAFFITLTFPWGTTTSSCCDYTSKFLKMYNERHFGPNYYKNSDFVEGFAFFEDHRSIVSENKKHVHMLIKCHKNYEKKTLTEHQSIFRKAAFKIKNNKGNNVFNKKCIDLRIYEDEGAISYSFKQIDDKNIGRIKILHKFGLSDNLENF